MSEPRIIKLPTWEECGHTVLGSTEPIQICALLYFTTDPHNSICREQIAAALNEAAQAGAEAARRGEEVRYEP